MENIQEYTYKETVATGEAGSRLFQALQTYEKLLRSLILTPGM